MRVDVYHRTDHDDAVDTIQNFKVVIWFVGATIIGFLTGVFADTLGYDGFMVGIIMGIGVAITQGLVDLTRDKKIKLYGSYALVATYTLSFLIFVGFGLKLGWGLDWSYFILVPYIIFYARKALKLR